MIAFLGFMSIWRIPGARKMWTVLNTIIILISVSSQMFVAGVLSLGPINPDGFNDTLIFAVRMYNRWMPLLQILILLYNSINPRIFTKLLDAFKGYNSAVTRVAQLHDSNAKVAVPSDRCIVHMMVGMISLTFLFALAYSGYRKFSIDVGRKTLSSFSFIPGDMGIVTNCLDIVLYLLKSVANGCVVMLLIATVDLICKELQNVKRFVINCTE